MTTLSIKGLQVDRSGIPVIRGVDLEAKGGEISVLLGSTIADAQLSGARHALH